ncbi:MAG: DEAD/DEAH box helicase, partial [Bacteroidia bacterium]
MNLGQGQTIHFAANYCIKEIDQFLTRNFEKGLVADFYNKFNDAKLEINKEILGIDYDIPLNKVVWNLLSRGIPTIASIRVSDYLLNKHFPEIYTSYNPNPSDPEIKLSFDFNQLAQELDSIQELLSMPMLSEKAVSQLGIVAYKLYQLQIDLSKVAKLQLTLLILSFTGKQFNYRLHNFDTELELLAIDDVNSFIKALNNLTVKSEPKVSEFGRTKGAAILDLSIAEGEEKKANDVVLFLNQKHDNSKSSDAFYKMLTDRNIRYGKFGEVENYEEDKKQKQRFNITNKKRKESLLFLLNNIFRKTDFRAGQEAILNRALLGKDVIGLLPTGGGKSLTYQINALLQPGVCIVIDPINSLMKDQFDKLFDELKITKTRYINSFNSKKEKEYNLKLLKTGKVQILFVSPERLQMPEFRTALKECQSAKVFFSCAVIDEAHCVSEWGHDFRHVYLNLAKNLKRFAKPKDSEITLFGLTATASFDVLADVQRELDVKEDAIISLPPDAIDRKELHFKVIDTSQEYIKPGLPFYEREDQVAALKYPILRNLLQYDLPNEITQLENEGSPFEINSDSFYRKVKGKYPNAGVIFCPTKSDFLKNGVMSIMEEIEDLN